MFGYCQDEDRQEVGHDTIFKASDYFQNKSPSFDINRETLAKPVSVSEIDLFLLCLHTHLLLSWT